MAKKKCTKPAYDAIAISIADGMKIWFRFGESKTTMSRTADQQAWDSGVLAAAEFVRRYTKDETLALQVMVMLTPTED